MAKKIYMCCGSDCKKRSKVRKEIRSRLVSAGLKKKIKKVGCQKICKGPVFGVEVDGRLEWFCRLEAGDSEQLAAAARGRAVGQELWNKRVKKRAGKLRD
jgi:hypothetical protein